MTVKDLLAQLANCTPEATVNVAVSNELEVNMYPANNIQIMTHNVEGKEIKNVMIITNINKH